MNSDYVSHTIKVVKQFKFDNPVVQEVMGSTSSPAIDFYKKEFTARIAAAVSALENTICIEFYIEAAWCYRHNKIAILRHIIQQANAADIVMPRLDAMFTRLIEHEFGSHCVKHSKIRV